MEIYIILLQDFLLGVVATWLFEQILKRNKKLKNRYYRHHEVLFGYHVHHSVYGLACFIASIVLFLSHRYSSAIFWLAFGVGIIFEHTISDRKFVFMEKQR